MSVSPLVPRRDFVSFRGADLVVAQEIPKRPDPPPAVASEFEEYLLSLGAKQDVMLGPIGQISMNAHDVDRATTFYAEVLKLPMLFRFGNLSFFNCGGVRLMLSTPEKPEFDHPGSVLYFKVDDIDATYREFQTRGVAFEGEPHLIARMPDHELWMAFFKDSEGNTLALMSEKR